MCGPQSWAPPLTQESDTLKGGEGRGDICGFTNPPDDTDAHKVESKATE